jgi:hypothetical protein
MEERKMSEYVSDGKVRLTLDLTYIQLYLMLEAFGITKPDKGLSSSAQDIVSDISGTAPHAPVAPAAGAAPDEPVAPAAQTDSSEVTIKELRDIAIELSRLKGTEAVRAALSKFGAKNLTSVSADAFKELKEEFLKQMK